MTSNAEEGRSFVRRDQLLKIQSEVQKRWEENKVFEVDAGNKPPKEVEKFFGNFPYPYMNGLLHLGHAFTVSKLEFGAAYRRLCGCNVLLPFAFHCTGMPIKESADKLCTREFGDKSAEKVCVDLRIRSQNDKEKLAEVKKLTNLKGFTDGAMLVGGFKGTKVQEAKPLIRNKLLVTGDAVMYSEPKRKSCLDQVMSVLWPSQTNDLIQNHLTFCIYNLTALLPEHHLPRGFRCNGHLTLNSEKISKSTGNFRTIRQAMEEFSSNATRFSLADAGDGMDDANFVLQENSDLIKRQLGLEHVEVLSASDEVARSKAGSCFSLLTQNPPSPGSPVAIFLSKLEYTAAELRIGA
ncbi:hypothetical protein BHE74_00027060 [Ensete ventricosum]|nr:hypothetical protein BHE74_00027060 [Ensete ventricosum]